MSEPPDSRYRTPNAPSSPGRLRPARLRLPSRQRVRVLSITALSIGLGTFDTLLLLGNNFGLLANSRRARWLLRRFRGLTSPTGRIVAEILDPYDTTAPEHHRYHRWNRRQGRMAGQTRIRVRYRDLATPWFDYLFVSPGELESILRGTGWQIDRLIRSSGPTYIAILIKG